MLPWTKELLDTADIGRLRPRWDGPFTVIACPSRNACTLALPREMRCSPTIIVDRLKPFFERVGAPPAPGPVSDPGQEGEHEAAAQPPPGARNHALPGALAGPHIRPLVTVFAPAGFRHGHGRPGPRLNGQDGALLLARLWLGSWDGGPA